MKILKKLLLIVLLTTIVMYIPTTVKATSCDEAIIQEAQKDSVIHIDLTNKEGISPLESFTEKTINFPAVWRSIRISITRTPGSSGISMAGINYGSNYVDVCIFKRGTNTIVGHTKTINPYASPIALIWTSSSLLDDTREVDLFFTMYGEYTNPMTVDVIY